MELVKNFNRYRFVVEVEASPDDIASEALRLGCRSVAFTYNDPVIFMEYAIDVADACRERGIRRIGVRLETRDAAFGKAVAPMLVEIGKQ